MTNIDSNKEWIYWGEADPLYAVATVAGKSARDSSPWSEAEFLEMGRRYFADVWSRWSEYGVGHEHCVEIGCGAGRITAQLVRHFRRLTAVDVSAHQLARAEALLGADRERVTFARVSSPVLPLASDSCDAMFCCEVFQHFDSMAPIHAYLRECGRVVRVGGTVCFQIPVHGLQRRSFGSSRIRTNILRVLRRLGRRRMMVYRSFEALVVANALDRAGFSRVEVRWFRPAAERGPQAFFFATRTAPS